MHFASQTSGVGPIRKKQENLLIVSHNPLQGYHFYKSNEKVGWAYLKNIFRIGTTLMETKFMSSLFPSHPNRIRLQETS